MKTSINPAETERDPRWAVVLARDTRADGMFYYSVETTGVYCRPSCASRLAKPENVRFHNTRDEAELAGFRPCKRCKPDQPSPNEQYSVIVADVCRYIEQAETAPDLAQMAARAGLSTYHFHRVFKRITGVTPKAYAQAHLASKLRQRLWEGAGITEAIFDAGYNASSRFYEKAGALLGMTPSSYRAGGNGMDIHFACETCSLGQVLVAGTERGICAILLGDDTQTLTQDLHGRFPNANLIAGDEYLHQLVAQVVTFVETPAAGLQLPLDIRGTAFQQRVWQALQQIPMGSTASYSQIAERIGAPKAVRAVAGACAANPVALAIPCHRILRNDGSISGYRWGVERKRALLEKEAASKQDEKP